MLHGRNPEARPPAGPSALRPAGRAAPALLALLLVAAAVVWVHAPVLKAQAYCFDDTQFLRVNRLVTHPGWRSTARFFDEVLQPSTVKGYYLPLTMTSLMLDYAAGRSTTDLRAFHRTNLALHALCAMLIVVLLAQLFGSWAAATIAALLFALHPLTVEPLAWVGERKTLLAACFALGSLVTYVRSVRPPSRGWRIASVALFLLALLSKPTVVMLPLLLIVLDAWPLRRLTRRSVMETWPYVLLALASAAVTLISHQRSAGIHAPGPGELALWPLRSAYLLSVYLARIVRPVNLTPVYVPPHPFAIANPAVGIPVATTVLLTLVLLGLRRRVPGALAGWLVFALAIAPTLGLVQYSWVIASDKYVYFPVLGILLALGAALAGAWNAPGRRAVARTLVIALAIPVLALEARGVRVALRPWADSMALSRHMEALAPESPRVLNRLGVILGESGQLDPAVDYLMRALARAPEYAEAHYNVAVLLGNEARFEEAIQHMEKAQALEPADPEAACLLGIFLSRAHRPHEAEAQLRRSIALAPDLLEARNQLGGLLVMQGRAAEGAEQFRIAVALDPGNADYHFRLGSARVIAGQSAAAIAPLERAVQLRPQWVQALNALAWLRATDPQPAVRDTAEALRLARRAAELSDRRDPKVLDTLAAAEAAAGRYAEALGISAEAIDLAYERHDPGLATQIETRRSLYKAGTAYLETAAERRIPHP